jgi:hypothetical protein
MNKIAYNGLHFMQSTQIVLLGCLSILSGCGAMDCLDKKTGIPQSSPTLQFSKENGLFSFTMKPDKAVVKLNDDYSFQIKNAWVEKRWTYECIDNDAVIQKDSSLQFVIEKDYKGDARGVHYRLIESTFGDESDQSSWKFNYLRQNTIKLWVLKENKIVDSIRFTK